MKVAVYYSNSDVRLEERSIPAIGPYEILVRMRACGICGTDVMEWYRKRKGPRVLGHEMAGEVVQIGEKAEGFNLGDRVFVSHHVPCYFCHYCAFDKESACEALHAGNFDPGGFAEYIRIPQANVKYGMFKLPTNMSYTAATMIEPLACSLAGQKRLNLKSGQTMLVIGCGVSGLTHIQLAKLKGVKVIATDINPHRLDKARQFGADHVIDAQKYSIDKLKGLNDGFLADAVVVCSGAESATTDAISSVGCRGEVLFFTVPNSPLTLPSTQFWRDEITVMFSYGAVPDDLREIMELMNSGSIEVSGLLTHSIQLEDIADGFRMVAAAAGESLKVVVTSG